jgi:hypothetical protein
MFNKYPNAKSQTPGLAASTASQRNDGYAADFLIARIANQASYSTYVESETDYPVATGTVHGPAEAGRNGAVSEIPLSQIGIYPGVASYKSDTPLITADGAPVKATGTGTWGQLYAAGRM